MKTMRIGLTDSGGMEECEDTKEVKRGMKRRIRVKKKMKIDR